MLKKCQTGTPYYTPILPVAIQIRVWVKFRRQGQGSRSGVKVRVQVSVTAVFLLVNQVKLLGERSKRLEEDMVVFRGPGAERGFRKEEGVKEREPEFKELAVFEMQIDESLTDQKEMIFLTQPDVEMEEVIEKVQDLMPVEAEPEPKAMDTNELMATNTVNDIYCVHNMAENVSSINLNEDSADILKVRILLTKKLP